MMGDKVMEIVIKRFARLGKALHGRLWIDGDHVCDTLENADRCLPPGKYELVRRKSPCGKPSVTFVASNGPHVLQECEVAVGECRYLGFLIHCQEYHVPLMDRVRKATSRHKAITVIIREDDDGGCYCLEYAKTNALEVIRR